MSQSLKNTSDLTSLIKIRCLGGISLQIFYKMKEFELKCEFIHSIKEILKQYIYSIYRTFSELKRLCILPPITIPISEKVLLDSMNFEKESLDLACIRIILFLSLLTDIIDRTISKRKLKATFRKVSTDLNLDYKQFETIFNILLDLKKSL